MRYLLVLSTIFSWLSCCKFCSNIERFKNAITKLLDILRTKIRILGICSRLREPATPQRAHYGVCQKPMHIVYMFAIWIFLIYQVSCSIKHIIFDFKLCFYFVANPVDYLFLMCIELRVTHRIGIVRPSLAFPIIFIFFSLYTIRSATR
jgi:hypothetical protein